MNRLICLAATGYISVILSSFAWADIPDPPPPPKVEITAPLKMMSDPRSEHLRIVIPRHLLADADLPEAIRPGDSGSFTPGAVRTMIAGIAFSLAAVSLIFIRRGNKKLRLAAAGLILLVAGLAVAVTPGWADIALPPPEKKVVLEFTSEGDAVQVIFGRNR